MITKTKQTANRLIHRLHLSLQCIFTIKMFKSMGLTGILILENVITLRLENYNAKCYIGRTGVEKIKSRKGIESNKRKEEKLKHSRLFRAFLQVILIEIQARIG